MGRHWKRLGSQHARDFGLFKARLDQLENPRTGLPFQAVVLELEDAVTVVARTREQHILVVDQFRFGVSEVTCELPAGIIDRGEEPLAAAVRELREETGHSASRWRSLGWVHSNPAYQNNKCHLFLAEDAVPTHALELDPGEDIVARALSPEQLGSEIREGRMRHILSLLALARVPGLWPALSGHLSPYPDAGE
jgi:8-oxo-dGTP pyrophosphatase MutT (NUDIX family)